MLGMDEVPLLHPKAASGFANELCVYKQWWPDWQACSAHQGEALV